MTDLNREGALWRLVQQFNRSNDAETHRLIQHPTALGDCIGCDGYILTESEKPYCPTCTRLLREGKAL